MTTHTIYLFNPDHDLALANGDENFDPPSLAQTFASDVACLPLWYAAPGDMVLASLKEPQWFSQIHALFPQIEDVRVYSSPDFSLLDEVVPWGWDAVVRKKLKVLGAGDRLLPSKNRLDEVRRLSHRRTAIDALQFLNDDEELAPFLPPVGRELLADEVKDFAIQYAPVVFKAPWSGSGRGLFWCSGNLSENALGWCRNVAKKQGCVMGERAYPKVLDFAMEFKTIDGKVSFEGYSLFETDSQGIYQRNLLVSDHFILKTVTGYISIDLLMKVQIRLQQFIQKKIASCYSGYLGVDMLIYRKEEAFYLHPCVEINLRMTMGMVARIFYDRFVYPSQSGTLSVDYFSSSCELMQDHLYTEKQQPLRVEDGRITQGYLSLSPVSDKSHYRVKVLIGRE
ncbi:MAG TPA: hypothetical protein PKH79_00715 [Prolixibacteraceae bacterium]|nr:hypothetical protein [Prolixibacteraceae bacterium]HPS11826.1 hypothetical protein [Prolixibacteraceae bacterium]